MASDEKLSGQFERTDVMARVLLLAGKYKLGRLIGEGGMGAVYEAEHEGLRAKVAVKLLGEHGALDAKSVARFRREARAMGAIHHENVVSVMDAGADEEGAPFLVMELLEGESLATLLRREKVLTPRLSAWIIAQALAGLSAAHAQGIIHRDLKPGNVFIARQSDGTHKVKILDFGISKLDYGESGTLDLTAEGALVGTPNFMAPEQVGGVSPVDARGDLYAIGVLLYRMVTGRLPYVGKTAEELYRRVLAGQYAPPSQVRADIPPALEAVIVKAMSLAPEARYQDAASMRSSLVAIEDELPGELPGEGAPSPTSTSSALHTPPVSAESQQPTVVSRRPGRTSAPPPHDRPSETAARLISPVSITEPVRAVQPAKRRWPISLGITGLVVMLVAGVFAGRAWLSGRGDDRGGQSAAHSAAVAAPADVHAADDPQTTAPIGEPLRYGVTRYSSDDKVKGQHQPIASYLERTLHRPVELVIAADDKDLEQRLFDGEIDLAALAALPYVRASRRQSPGLSLLAQPVGVGGPSYQGVVVTRADSGIQSLDGLRGKPFCYVHPGSTSGYLYPRALLREAGLDPDRDLGGAHYGGDHLSTLRLLDRGVCAAAAVFEATLTDGDKSGIPRSRFHQLAETVRIPYDAYVVLARMPSEQADAIAQALLALGPNTEAAHEVLAASGDIVGFTAASDSDYDSVRRIEAHVKDAAK